MRNRQFFLISGIEPRSTSLFLCENAAFVKSPRLSLILHNNCSYFFRLKHIMKLESETTDQKATITPESNYVEPLPDTETATYQGREQPQVDYVVPERKKAAQHLRPFQINVCLMLLAMLIIAGIVTVAIVCGLGACKA